MRAGRLRHRVTIQRPVNMQSEYGSKTGYAWEDLATVWASVEPLRGREFLDAEAEGAEVTTRIVIRYRENVGPACRVVWGTRAYDVVSTLSVEERDRQIELMCREVL